MVNECRWGGETRRASVTSAAIAAPLVSSGIASVSEGGVNPQSPTSGELVINVGAEPRPCSVSVALHQSPVGSPCGTSLRDLPPAWTSLQRITPAARSEIHLIRAWWFNRELQLSDSVARGRARRPSPSPSVSSAWPRRRPAFWTRAGRQKVWLFTAPHLWRVAIRPIRAIPD